MYRGLGVIALIYGLSALIMSFVPEARTSRGWRLRPLPFLSLATTAAALVLTPTVLGRLAIVQPNPANPVAVTHVVDVATGPEGVVAVLEGPGVRVLQLNNHYTLGATAAHERQRRLGLLPLLLHPAPRDVAIIGLATGITAGAVFIDPEVCRVTAVEISPLVVAMARKHFEPFSGELFRDSRSRVVTEDGRIYIAARTHDLDVVIRDLFLPWRPGVSRLYSLEHFQAVHRALRRDGLFCQWLPMYQLRAEHFEVIVQTMRSVFGSVFLVRDNTGTTTPAFGLIGIKGRALDIDVLVRRIQSLKGLYGDTELQDPVTGRLFLWTHRLVPDPATPINTLLDNAWIGLRTALDRLSGRTDYFKVQGERLERYIRGLSDGLSDAAR